MAFLLAGLVIPAHVGHPPAALPLRHGYALLRSERLSIVNDEALPPMLSETARKLSRRGRVVYAEAEFFGGTGAQAAVGWERGAVVYGPIRTQSRGEGFDGFDEVAELDDWAINRALRWLGVEPEAGLDAFATLGLGGRRSWLDEAD
jgi:hypothetical protein